MTMPSTITPSTLLLAAVAILILRAAATSYLAAWNEIHRPFVRFDVRGVTRLVTAATAITTVILVANPPLLVAIVIGPIMLFLAGCLFGALDMRKLLLPAR